MTLHNTLETDLTLMLSSSWPFKRETNSAAESLEILPLMLIFVL